MNGNESWSHRQFDRFAQEPFWKSAPFFLLAALFAIDLIYGAWIVDRFWRVLPGDARFRVVFLLVTSPLILLGTIQLQRYVRQSQLDTRTAKPILALTFGIASWAYGVIGIALNLVLSTLRLIR